MKSFNFEMLQEILDNSFCELVNTDASFEILKKVNKEDIFIYYNDVNDEYILQII